DAARWLARGRSVRPQAAVPGPHRERVDGHAPPEPEAGHGGGRRGLAMVQYRAEQAGGGAFAGLLLGGLDFRLLVVGQVISTCGDMLYLVALPFLVFGRGGSPTTLAATLTVHGLA